MKSKKLTDKNNIINNSPSLLTSKLKVPFKISIEHSLTNGFDFKQLKPEAIKKLHSFIEDTVGAEKTISEVETIYLRTKGPISKEEQFNGETREVIHFGKDQTTFRIHGYYNKEGWYFVLCKIDPNHAVHS